MLFSNGSVVDNDSHKSNRYSKNGCCSGNWSGFNIAAMVIGFILFWPLGLVVLYWNITGRNLKDLPDAFQQLWAKIMNISSQKNNYSVSDNTVFDEYQQTQYDRIREIKDEIIDRAGRFKTFRSDVKRRAEEREFNDFMSKNPDA